MRHSFTRLMTRMGVANVAQVVRTGGYYDDSGVWVPGVVSQTAIRPAALLTLTDDDLAQDTGGTRTADDRKLICYQDLVQGTQVLANGENYTVAGRRDYSDYAPGLNTYILQRAGEADD